MRELRKLLAKTVGEILIRLDSDIFVSYEQGRHEFLGVVPLAQWELESVMEEMGFERNPLAAWKTLSGTSKEEQGSWRYVDANDEYYGLTPPREATGYERGGWHAHQLHVILYELDGDENSTAVCVHHELAWDSYPIGHYQGDYYDPDFGIRMFSAMMDDHGVPYDSEVTVDELVGK